MIPDFNIEDYYIFNQVIVDVDDTSKIEETKRNIENEVK